MNWSLLFLCVASSFVDAANGQPDFKIILEEPSSKIQHVNLEEAASVQKSNLLILADLVPLFLHFSDHKLAHSLSQVNRTCYLAVCNSCFEATKTLPRIIRGSNSLDLAERAEKIILNFAFQHFVKTKDAAHRDDTLIYLVRILAGLDNNAICVAVSEMLKGMGFNQSGVTEIFQTLTVVHRHREAKATPTPYSTIYPKIIVGGYESFSEEINNEITRMLVYKGFPTCCPIAFAKNSEVYHKFFQDMVPIFPDFYAQKYQELDDMDEFCPLVGFTVKYSDFLSNILGPSASLVVRALPTEPIYIRFRADDFDYLWKVLLNKLNFFPWHPMIEVGIDEDCSDPELWAEIGRFFRLIRALKTSDVFSFRGLSDTKIFRLLNYITHSFRVDPTLEYGRSVAAKVVNAKDTLTPFRLYHVLHLAGHTYLIHQLMEKKISTLPMEECAFEPFKFLNPITILSYAGYHNFCKLPQSLGPHIRSNLHRIARGDKEMTRKYNVTLGFMFKTFPSLCSTTASLIVSAALSDEFLSEEQNMFFLFEQIPIMNVFLRQSYYSIVHVKNAQRINL